MFFKKLSPKKLGQKYFCVHQDKVKLWLNTALKKEEESWLSGRTPELNDHYCFSPLAIDVIQVRCRIQAVEVRNSQYS